MNNRKIPIQTRRDLAAQGRGKGETETLPLSRQHSSTTRQYACLSDQKEVVFPPKSAHGYGPSVTRCSKHLPWLGLSPPTQPSSTSDQTQTCPRLTLERWQLGNQTFIRYSLQKRT